MTEDRPTRELVDAALGRYLAEGDRAAQWDRPTLRRELWAVLDRDPQSDRDLVETVRNLAALAARTPLPAEPSIAERARAMGVTRRPLVDVLIEAGVPSAPLPAVPDGEEAAVDEMEGHFIDANERMGEALVAIGMALGLPRPCVGATWGAPEILARIAQWNGSLGSCYDHSILGHDDARVAAPVVGCSDCLDALTTPLPAGEDVPARLDDAAEAVAYFGMGHTATTFRDLAILFRDSAPEVRAAVAAALARPTGGQE